MANINVEVKSTVINDGETAIKTNILNVTSKEGLVTETTMIAGDNRIEVDNRDTVTIGAKANDEVTVVTAVMNNYGDKLSNIDIVGSIPENAILNSEIVTDIENSTVKYYAGDNTETTDLNNARSFKIESDNELDQGEIANIGYKYTLNENATEQETSEMKVRGEVQEVSQEEVLTYIANLSATPNMVGASTNTQNDVKVEIEPKAMTNTLHQGQIVTYNISVTNISNDNLNNINLNYNVPTGAVLTVLTDAQGEDMTFKDDTQTRTKTWTIESIKPNQTVTEEVTIKINNGTTQIVNNVTLTNQNNEVISNTTTNPVDVIEGKLTVRLVRNDNMNIAVESGDSIEYVVVVKNNTNANMNNVKIKSKIEDGTTWIEDSEDNDEWTYDSSAKEINYTISTLSAGATEILTYEVKVDDNNTSPYIDGSALVIYGQNEYATNIYRSELDVNKSDYEIVMTSEHNDTLKIGDKVKYIIKAKNNNISGDGIMISIVDSVPLEINIDEISYYTDQNRINTVDIPENDVKIKEMITDGKILTVEITGTVIV